MDGIEPLAPRDRVYGAATAPACPYLTSQTKGRSRPSFRNLVAGPGVAPQIGFSRLAALHSVPEVGQARLPVPSRRMRPRGFLTDLPAQMVRRLSTPPHAAGTSAVSRNGGCLTCRSPHRRCRPASNGRQRPLWLGIHVEEGRGLDPQWRTTRSLSKRCRSPDRLTFHELADGGAFEAHALRHHRCSKPRRPT